MVTVYVLNNKDETNTDPIRDARAGFTTLGQANSCSVC